MRFTLLLSLLLSATITSGADTTPSLFFEGTWEQARAKAKKENKYIFLDCWTEWCGYCKMMDSETFVDPAVVDFMSKNFVSVSRDMERGEGRLLNMKYHTQGYPTYYIFTPQGQLCFELSGYTKPKPWIDTLRSALKPENQHVCTGFSDELEPGYPEFYKASFGVRDERKVADSAEVASWLSKQSDLSSEVCWGVLWFYKGSFEQQQWMFENGEKLYSLYGEQVWNAVSGAIGYRAYRAQNADNVTEFERLMGLAELYLPEPFKSDRIYYSRSFFYKEKKMWKEYTLLTDTYLQKSDYKGYQLNNMAWEVYDNATDTLSWKLACYWAERGLSEDSTWYMHDTYAHLLFRVGRLEEAEKQALLAIELASKEGEAAPETHKLLAEIRATKKGN